MQTLGEIRAVLRRLPVEQRMAVEAWLQEFDGIPVPENQVQEAVPDYLGLASYPSFLTLEEYLELEGASPLRHELINGVLFAMNGPSVLHQHIVSNLMRAISHHIQRPCKVFSSGLRLVIQRKSRKISYYPDVVVDCRPSTHDRLYIRDPKLIVEILSPSTQRIDRFEKLQSYRDIDSVEEYVIVAQDEKYVAVYSRAERWKPRVYGRDDVAVEFRSIALTMPMSELYDCASGARE